jgi:hypothetical protein
MASKRDKQDGTAAVRPKKEDAQEAARLKKEIEKIVNKSQVDMWNCGLTAPDLQTVHDMEQHMMAQRETVYPLKIEYGAHAAELLLTIRHVQGQMAQDPDGETEAWTSETPVLTWSPRHKNVFTEPLLEQFGRTVFVADLVPAFKPAAATMDDDDTVSVQSTSSNSYAEEKKSQDKPEEVTVYVDLADDCIISAYSRARFSTQTLLHKAQRPTVLRVIIN